MTIHIVSYESAAGVKWAGDSKQYDIELAQLGTGHEKFAVLNPWTQYKDDYNFIKEIPDTEKCVVWNHCGEWIVKVFTQGWNPDLGYQQIELSKPPLVWQYNKSIPSNIEFDNPGIDYNLDYADHDHEMIWYIDPVFAGDDDIWVYKCKVLKEQIIGYRNMGYLQPVGLKPKLDVVFISYNETNAEKNWLRVLEKAPHAKRVNGVKGILEAHRAAAKLSSTDMFYVVDGDAYLADDWTFDFRPSIFDSNCSFVWKSVNPVNNLVYENGGVKLFPKQKLTTAVEHHSLDIFKAVSTDIKSIDQVSCINTYNTCELSSWRSAFRESVKLYTINNVTTLDAWLTKGKRKHFGKYSAQGAADGMRYAKEHSSDPTALLRINDYHWLEEQFNLRYGCHNKYPSKSIDT